MQLRCLDLDAAASAGPKDAAAALKQWLPRLAQTKAEEVSG